jgi:hypothetical protein
MQHNRNSKPQLFEQELAEAESFKSAAIGMTEVVVCGGGCAGQEGGSRARAVEIWAQMELTKMDAEECTCDLKEGRGCDENHELNTHPLVISSPSSSSTTTTTTTTTRPSSAQAAPSSIPLRPSSGRLFSISRPSSATAAGASGSTSLHPGLSVPHSTP